MPVYEIDSENRGQLCWGPATCLRPKGAKRPVRGLPSVLRECSAGRPQKEQRAEVERLHKKEKARKAKEVSYKKHPPPREAVRFGAQKHHEPGGDGPADLVAGRKKPDPPSFAAAGATLWRQENARGVHLKKEFAVGAASLVHESGTIILVFDPTMGVKQGTPEKKQETRRRPERRCLEKNVITGTCQKL